MAVNVTWRPGIKLPHDPDDVDDIELDMSAVVGAEDTLTDADIESSGVGASILTSDSTGVVVFRVTGGTAGNAGSVTVQITMASGRKQSRTINFDVRER